jgi:hypothetical protein
MKQIIVVKGLNPDQVLSWVDHRHELQSHPGEEIVMVFLDHDQELSMLDEEDMRRAGWVKVPPPPRYEPVVV